MARGSLPCRLASTGRRQLRGICSIGVFSTNFLLFTLSGRAARARRVAKGPGARLTGGQWLPTVAFLTRGVIELSPGLGARRVDSLHFQPQRAENAGRHGEQLLHPAGIRMCPAATLRRSMRPHDAAASRVSTQLNAGRVCGAAVWTAGHMLCLVLFLCLFFVCAHAPPHATLPLRIFAHILVDHNYAVSRESPSSCLCTDRSTPSLNRSLHVCVVV